LLEHSFIFLRLPHLAVSLALLPLLEHSFRFLRLPDLAVSLALLPLLEHSFIFLRLPHLGIDLTERLSVSLALLLFLELTNYIIYLIQEYFIFCFVDKKI
jgi:hypothetical protein